ncbi:hypothetical protein AB1N83_007157 [Pleurotus pulmonarius]
MIAATALVNYGGIYSVGSSTQSVARLAMYTNPNENLIPPDQLSFCICSFFSLVVVMSRPTVVGKPVTNGLSYLHQRCRLSKITSRRIPPTTSTLYPTVHHTGAEISNAI